MWGQYRGSFSSVCVHTWASRSEQCLAASVLGAQDLLVGGDHLAVMHIHDLGADLAIGGGHWGMGERRR